MPEVQKIQWRRGTAAEWTTANPVLSAGTPGLETDTNKFKVGDGVKDWKTLAYQGGGVDVHALTVKAIPVDADELVLADSAATPVGGLKKFTFTDFKAWFKAWWSVEPATLTRKTLTDPKIEHIYKPTAAGSVSIWDAPSKPDVEFKQGITLFYGDPKARISAAPLTTSNPNVDLDLAGAGTGHVSIDGFKTVTQGAVPTSGASVGRFSQIAPTPGMLFVNVGAKWQQVPLVDFGAAAASGGGTGLAVVDPVKTAAFTAAPGQLVLADATAGGFTVSLPDKPADGSVVSVRKTDSTVNTVAVQRSGATDVLFGGATSFQLAVPGQRVTLSYKAGVWHVIGDESSIPGLDTRYVAKQQQGVSTKLPDVNGATGFSIDAVTGAENYLAVQNAAKGNQPSLRAQGNDANVSVQLWSKGNSGVTFFDGNSRVLANFTPGSNAVNYPDIRAAGTGWPVQIMADGNDASVSLNLVTKGPNGVVQANGKPVGVKVAVPANATAPGHPGQWATDTGFVYWYTGDGTAHTWVRAAAAAW